MPWNPTWVMVHLEGLRLMFHPPSPIPRDPLRTVVPLTVHIRAHITFPLKSFSYSFPMGGSTVCRTLYGAYYHPYNLPCHFSFFPDHFTTVFYGPYKLVRSLQGSIRCCTNCFFWDFSFVWLFDFRGLTASEPWLFWKVWQFFLRALDSTLEA